MKMMLTFVYRKKKKADKPLKIFVSVFCIFFSRKKNRGVLICFFLFVATKKTQRPKTTPMALCSS